MSFRALPPAPEPLPLNGVVELSFVGGALDPRSVTPASVQVRSDGTVLDREVEVTDAGLIVRLVVDQALLADPPSVIEVVLGGSPSLHALRDSGGRRLDRTQSFRVGLEPRLARAAWAPRLISVEGAAPGRASIRLEGGVSMGFDGVLDPSTMDSACCPLAAVRTQLSLRPIVSTPVWRIIGLRTELELPVDEGTEPLTLRSRDWALTDDLGRAPSPLISVELVR